MLPSGKRYMVCILDDALQCGLGHQPLVPKCGEIDIMEEVGADADRVSSSLHTEKYNHTKGTQKTHEMKCAGAEGGFHTYALEWTEDAITTYVDGKVQAQSDQSRDGFRP